MKKGILEQISDEYDTYQRFTGEKLNPRFELIEGLDLKPGYWIEWIYEDDWNFLIEDGLTEQDIKSNYMSYRGLICQLPDTESFRVEENAVVMVTKYPVEKENAQIDYCSLISLLDNEDLKFIIKS